MNFKVKVLTIFKWINKKKKIILTILLLFFGTIIYYDFIARGRTIVTREELNLYIREYFSMYKKLVEENNEYFIIITNNTLKSIMPSYIWQKYNFNPVYIEGIISNKHGAGVHYEYEFDIKSYFIKIVNIPIEKHFWSNIYENIGELSIVRISIGEYYLDDSINIKKGTCLQISANAILISKKKYSEAFKIDDFGAINVKGTLLLNNSMILKGNNNKVYWSRPQADYDALYQFLNDAKEVLNKTTLNDIKYKYKPYILLDKIQYGIKIKYYRDNPHAFYEDYDELIKSKFNNEIVLSDIWNEYKKIQLYVEPTLLEKIANNPYVKGITIALIVAILSTYLKK